MLELHVFYVREKATQEWMIQSALPDSDLGLMPFIHQEVLAETKFDDPVRVADQAPIEHDFMIDGVTYDAFSVKTIEVPLP